MNRLWSGSHMIKLELVTISEKKALQYSKKHNAIRRWSQKYSWVKHRVSHDRNYIEFYDDEAFEKFKETYKETWRRLY